MLNRRSLSVLDAVLPTGAHPRLDLGIHDVGFHTFYREEFVPKANLSMRLGFRLALWMALWVGPLLIFRLPPLSLHRQETRERALNAMFDSRFNVIRQMALLLKVTVGFAYGAHPDVRRRIDYPPQFDDPEVSQGLSR